MTTCSTRIGDGRSGVGALRRSRQQGSRRWRVTSVLSAVAAACMVMAALAAPGVCGASVQQSGGGRVEVLSPPPGALVWNASKKAAARTKVSAIIRFIGGRVAHLSVQLNGHRVGGIAAHSGRQRVVLSTRNGLTVGYNVLFVGATLAGSGHPVQMARRFVVGYKTTQHLLTWSGVRRGAGSAPAALLTARAPLTGMRRISAWLNGRRLLLPGARIGKHGHRVLDLNLAQLGRLRFGRNDVQVRVVMNDGRLHDLRHAFTLDRRRDIAVARLVARAPGTAVVGRTLMLDASGSRLAGGRLHARWFLLRKPKLSHARLGAATGTRSRLRPDVPGNYVVGLRTGAGSGAGYDVLTASATYPEPLVPIDTAATQGGQSGLLVGGPTGQFYAYDSNAIQVVQLDGYSLEATHYNTYQATSQSLAQMKSDLSAASPDALVIVAAPDGRPDLPSDQVGNLDAALGEIGGVMGSGWSWGDANCWQGNTLDCSASDLHNSWTNTTTDLGPFTIVGVLGMPAGQAWRETASQTSAAGGVGTGGITGYLTPGVASTGGMSTQYTLIAGSDPYVPVVTCATVGSATCAVTVGSAAYPAAPGVNGVHVVVLDRTTLALQNNATVTDYAHLETALNTTQSEQAPTSHSVVHYVTGGGQSDQSLVIVQSVGSGSLSGSPSPGGYLYEYLDQLGGTPESLQGSLAGGQPYALVGLANNLPWYGTSALESSRVMDTSSAPGQPNGQINGMLERDRTGLFAPVGGSPGGPINSDLYAIVFQPAQPWPYAGDPALSYIANGIQMGGYPDVRSGYTNLNIDFDSKASLLKDLHCTGESFCGTDFNEVKSELLDEFAWVSTVRSFIDNLLSPYEQNGGGAVFAVDSIYDDIENSLPPPPKMSTSLNWLSVVGDALDIGAGIAGFVSGPASAALTIGSGAFGLGSNFLVAPGGGTANTVTADAPDDLSAQLADQQTAAVEGIDRLEAILLTDYGKLSAVGTKAGGGDPSWAWTADTTLDTITALNASTRGASYTSLIPEIYEATDLAPDPDTDSTWATTNDVTKYACNNDDHPFAPALPQNQFHAISRFSPTTPANVTTTNVSDVWVLANNVNSSSIQFPTSSLTDDIYGPDATGADGADQYAPDWWRTTYNPPGGEQCHPPNPGAWWPAPAITPPPP
ncbi:MAG: hypothetical protein ACJ780_03930 [Solirubrobacteraceae bacterium]